MLDRETEIQVVPHCWVYAFKNVLLHQKYNRKRTEGGHHIEVFVNVHVDAIKVILVTELLLWNPLCNCCSLLRFNSLLNFLEFF